MPTISNFEGIDGPAPRPTLLALVSGRNWRAGTTVNALWPFFAHLAFYSFCSRLCTLWLAEQYKWIEIYQGFYSLPTKSRVCSAAKQWLQSPNKLHSQDCLRTWVYTCIKTEVGNDSKSKKFNKKWTNQQKCVTTIHNKSRLVLQQTFVSVATLLQQTTVQHRFIY